MYCLHIIYFFAYLSVPWKHLDNMWLMSFIPLKITEDTLAEHILEKAPVRFHDRSYATTAIKHPDSPSLFNSSSRTFKYLQLLIPNSWFLINTIANTATFLQTNHDLNNIRETKLLKYLKSLKADSQSKNPDIFCRFEDNFLIKKSQ